MASGLERNMLCHGTAAYGAKVLVPCECDISEIPAERKMPERYLRMIVHVHPVSAMRADRDIISMQKAIETDDGPARFCQRCRS